MKKVFTKKPISTFRKTDEKMTTHSLRINSQGNIRGLY